MSNFNGNLANFLKLEIEQAPTGLVNLVQNPSGELGGYGWVTPVPGSVLKGTISPHTDYKLGLEYTNASTTNSANYFTTEAMPVSAGQYVAASWHVNYTPYNAYRVRLQWLDLSGAILSSTAFTDYSGSYADHTFAPIVAPAGTAFVKLYFEVAYAGPAYPNTYGGLKFSIRNVTVSKAATYSALATVVRTNLITNPSGETAFTGWTAIVSNATFAVTRANTLGGFSGTYSFVGNRSAGTGDVGVELASRVNVTAGQNYSFSFYGRSGTATARTYVARILFYDSAGTLLGTFTGTPVSITSAPAWSRVSVAGATAPVGATTANVQAVVQAPGIGENHGFDGFLFEQSTTVGTYFDGSTTAGSLTYAWTGTAHASTSTATALNFAFIEPVPYVDILSTVRDVKIVREDLNVGTLNAKVLSEQLDPKVSNTIRPGRRVRLSAYNTDSLKFEPIFVGKILNANVVYDLKRKSKLPGDNRYAQISLTAVDAVQALASVKRKSGVGIVGELPYVLEGAGVPWVCDGNSNQVPTATVVSKNEDASAIDQISITRDSVLGYAWADRYGTLQAWSGLPKPNAEIIPNGDFESAITGPPWYPQADAGTPTLVKSTAQKFSGTSSALLTNTNAAATVCQFETYLFSNPASYGSLAVIPGATYHFSVRTMAVSTARTIHAYLRWYTKSGDANAFIGDTAANINYVTDNSTGWTEMSFDVTAPTNATAADVVAGFSVPTGSIPAGEGHYFDAMTLKPVSTPVTLSESRYSNIDVSFSTDDCINYVTVKFLRYNKKSKSTEEILYGPYTDDASISEWGRHSAEFTVQSATEDVIAIRSLANSVLSANGTPEVRVNGAVVPIKDQTYLNKGGAFLDLYDLVNVINTGKAINEYSRVTRIEHTITPDGWLVNVGFVGLSSVASPQVTPSVQGRLDPSIGSGPASVPVGGIQLFAGSPADIPTGWLNCDGSAVSRTTYANLFAVIGTTFGVGDGSTTFNLPDMRRRAPMGVGTGRSLGSDDGLTTVTDRSPSHTHSISGQAADPTPQSPGTAAGSVPRHVHYDGHAHGGSTGSALGFTGLNGFPNLTLNFIIKA